MSVLGLTLLLLVSTQAQQSSAARECVQFSSNGRLRHDQRFTTPLLRGINLHVTPDGAGAWGISVSHPKSKYGDYMWVVSPPFVTGRAHVQIGPGYGLTAAESLFDRDLRFVVNDMDYEEAYKFVRGELDVDDPLDQFRRLGRGTLKITFTGHGLRSLPEVPSGEQALDWIAFTGEACIRAQ